jgi:hypothetical protein
MKIENAYPKNFWRPFIEMARRKMQFHPEKRWDQIVCWGLFTSSEIKYHLEQGLLIGAEHKINKGYRWWFVPSEEAWGKFILPILQSYTLRDATQYIWGSSFDHSNKRFDIYQKETHLKPSMDFKKIYLEYKNSPNTTKKAGSL